MALFSRPIGGMLTLPGPLPPPPPPPEASGSTDMLAASLRRCGSSEAFADATHAATGGGRTFDAETGRELRALDDIPAVALAGRLVPAEGVTTAEAETAVAAERGRELARLRAAERGRTGEAGEPLRAWEGEPAVAVAAAAADRPEPAANGEPAALALPTRARAELVGRVNRPDDGDGDGGSAVRLPLAPRLLRSARPV